MTTPPASPTATSGRRRRPIPRRLGRSIAATAILALALIGAYPAPAAHADATFNQRLTALINQDRSANGLAPLQVQTQLASIAEGAPYSGCGFTVYGRAVDMGQRNYFSHTIPSCGGNDVFDIMSSAGVANTWAAENIGWASHSADPATVAQYLHTMFMNSAGHRANILSPNATHVGVGSWRTAPGQTWSGSGTARSNAWLTAVVFSRMPATAAKVPSPPTGVVAGAPSTVSGAIDVAWAGAAPNGATVDTYVAYAFNSAGYVGRYAVVCGSCRAARITGLASGGAYYVGVYAHNSVGWGPPAYSGWVVTR